MRAEASRRKQGGRHLCRLPARLPTKSRCFLVAYTSNLASSLESPLYHDARHRITVLERSTDTGAGRGTQCPGSKMVQRQTYQHMFMRPPTLYSYTKIHVTYTHAHTLAIDIISPPPHCYPLCA